MASLWQVGSDTLSEFHPCAPVAQLDRAVASEATGREFESLRAHHLSLSLRSRRFPQYSFDDTFHPCRGLGAHLGVVFVEPAISVYFSAINSNAPIFLKSLNSSAFLNHFPEYVSGLGLRSGIRRVSTFLKPCFSSSALYSASDSACTGTFSS